MILTKAFARLIVLVTCLARKAPVSLGSALDDLAFSLVGFSRHLPPMPRTSLQPGAPFIGKAACEDIDCRAKWTVFSPLGGDRDLVICCPRCDGETGVIA